MSTMRSLLMGFTLLIAFMMGCQPGSEASTASVVVINGNPYYGQGTVRTGEYTLKEKIGTVQSKVDSDVMPVEDYSSNTLKVGTAVFSIEEDHEIFLIERSSHEFQVFSIEGQR
ncbi:hypothetical protein [Rossellomorea sp. NS-SX7]|uniref:hypothetical protein n=1 Tax=Rossellomorea sp. NS-SX7 TaxID=3463856 RepID=UPI004059AA36